MDATRLLNLAKKNLANGKARLQKWWSKKYNLPPNHELFENQSEAELTLEMYTDFLIKREELTAELEEGITDMDYRNRIHEQLSTLNNLLGDSDDKISLSDPLIDKWEAEIAAGIIPNLEETEIA